VQSISQHAKFWNQPCYRPHTDLPYTQNTTTAPGCTLFSGLKKLTWRTGLGGC
jgi:hypothetical protein